MAHMNMDESRNYNTVIRKNQAVNDANRMIYLQKALKHEKQYHAL